MNNFELRTDAEKNLVLHLNSNPVYCPELMGVPMVDQFSQPQLMPVKRCGTWCSKFEMHEVNTGATETFVTKHCCKWKHAVTLQSDAAGPKLLV